mmetsp:Transcript_96195/g.170787  ORF Transcript_96195/g.170787 Transcript_96195/m.170787 type:complete len:455 (-) Transcript_96195:40-1404(-)
MYVSQTSPTTSLQPSLNGYASGGYAVQSIGPANGSMVMNGTVGQRPASVGEVQLFLFVNPGSGGNKGQVFLQAANPFKVDLDDGTKAALNIYSLLDGESGNKKGFHHLKQVIQSLGGKPVRVVVGGGDGTVMWADTEATKHGIDTPTQVQFGIMPLGTGNDFSRVAGWGGNNPCNVEDNDWALLTRMVKQWMAAIPRPHDVWEVTVSVDESTGKLTNIGKTKEEEDVGVNSKTFAMINYFSIGQESQVGMHFDKHRTKSQTCNLFVYGLAGLGQELRCWGVQHIGNVVANLYQGTKGKGTLILDSEGDAGEPELIGNPESLMFLNIPSYAGGKANLWQKDQPSGVEPAHPPEAIDVDQDPGDGRLECVTLPNIANIALDKLHHFSSRVYSGGPYFLEFFKDDEADIHAFFEVDGEFYHAINPESAAVRLQKKLSVLQNSGEKFDESDEETGWGC